MLHYLVNYCIVAMLHSNGQHRTDTGGDTEKGVKNLPYEQKITDEDY